MKTLAVTGIDSPLGTKFLSLVEQDPSVETVVGVGPTEPKFSSKKLVFVKHELTDRYNLVFADHKADTAIHLGLQDCTSQAEADAQIEGFRQFIEATKMARCQTVALRSTVLSYGAHEDNLEVLYEGSFLRPTSFTGRAAEEMEKLCYGYAHHFPNALLQILRTALVVGPHSENILTRALRRSLLLVPSDSDVAFQFVHEDDVARAMHCLIDSGAIGIFNLAADSALTIDQVAQLAEVRLIRSPLAVYNKITGLGRLLGLRNPPWFPHDAIAHARYSVLVANIKFRQEVYFDFLHDSPEAFIEGLLDPVPEEGMVISPHPLDSEFDMDEDLLDELTATPRVVDLDEEDVQPRATASPEATVPESDRPKGSEPKADEQTAKEPPKESSKETPNEAENKAAKPAT